MNGKRALIYVFRPGKLAGDLAGSEAGKILERCGYCSGNCAECFARHKKCTRLYCQQCERGKAMEHLAVAG